MDLALGLQVAQKRHRHLQIAHGVGPAHHVVDEVERAVVERQVVQREPGRFGRWLVRRRRQALDDVVDIVAAIAQVREPGHRCVNGDGVHHRRQPEQRLQLRIHIDTLDAHLVGLAVGRGDRQV